MNKSSYNYSVSVVIPTYNRKISVVKSIESALNQTHSNTNVVVCDDHSTDGSYDYLVDRYKDDDRVVVCRTPVGHKGANAARNEAIRNTKGEYIAFLDSDDILTNDSIEIRLSKAIEKDVDFVYGNFIIDQRGKQKYLRHIEIPHYEYREYFFHELALCAFSAILVKRNKIDFLLDESLPAWQDDDFISQMIINNDIRMEYIDYPVAIFFAAEGNISSSKVNEYIGLKKMLIKHKDNIVQYCSYKHYTIWRLRLFQLRLECFVSQKDSFLFQIVLRDFSMVLKRIISRHFYKMYV